MGFRLVVRSGYEGQQTGEAGGIFSFGQRRLGRCTEVVDEHRATFGKRKNGVFLNICVLREYTFRKASYNGFRKSLVLICGVNGPAEPIVEA